MWAGRDRPGVLGGDVGGGESSGKWDVLCCLFLKEKDFQLFWTNQRLQRNSLLKVF